MYKSYSVNIVNFVTAVGDKKQCCSFFKEMGPLISQPTVSMNCFTDNCCT